MDGPPLVGRREELNRIGGVIGVDARRTVVILGDPGIGKSALLDSVRVDLEHAGRIVETVVAASGGMDLPLAPFSRFTASEGPSVEEPAEVVRRVVNTLRSLSRRDEAVLVVDDAQNLDDVSLVVVEQLARDADVPVILAARSTDRLPDGLAHLIESHATELVELGPLRRSETDELVRSDLGRRERTGEVSPTVLEEVWRASRGVPFHVRDLLEASIRSGALALEPVTGWTRLAPFRSSARFADMLASRVDGLGPGCSRVVRALAVAGPLPAVVVETLDPADERLRAERSGILRRRSLGGRGVVTFAHDLYYETASGWIGQGERQRIVAEIADLLGSVPDPTPEHLVLRAEMSLQAGDGGSAEPDLYERGAEAACFSCYDPERALRLADAAIARGAGVPAALVRLAALGLLGRSEDAAHGFRELEDATAQDPVGSAMVSSAHAWHLLFNTGDADGAIAALDRALERAVTDGNQQIADDLRGRQVTALLFAGRHVDAAEAGERVRGGAPGGALAPESAFGLASSLAIIGRADEALDVAERALASPDDSQSNGHDLTVNMVWNRMLAMWQLGRLGELAGPWDGLSPRRWGGADWLATCMVATLDLLRGSSQRSVDGYESAWDLLMTAPAHVVSFNTVLRATGEANLGHGHRAAELLASLRRFPPAVLRAFPWWSARAEVLVLAAEGRIAEAVHGSLSLADAHPGEEFHVTTSLHDVVRFGQPGRVVHRLEVQAARDRSTWWDRVCWAHARAAHGRDIEALVTVSRRFERGGRLLDAAEAAAQAATFSADATASSEDRVRGAAAAARVRALLAHTGPLRTPALVPGPGPLSERELVVARLAAAGWTNGAIAEHLGTSVRTVGNQLQSAYLKLGVHSREELRSLVE